MSVIPGPEASKSDMVSLGDVLSQTTIQKRKDILSNFLNENDVGKLSEENSNHFRHIFQQFYTPDKGEEKHEDKDIKEWSNKCFILVLHHAESPEMPAAIKYLAGSKRPETQNNHETRAARRAIQPQIDEFKDKNRLNADDICPLGNGEVLLGWDAQVDHEILFKDLWNDWKKKNTRANVKTNYNYDIFDHKFVKQETLESWRTYHQNHAILRWLSKTGNQNRFGKSDQEEMRDGEQ